MTQFETALTPNTRAIVASHPRQSGGAGCAAHFADKPGLDFIEDNCESMDAEIDGRKAGTFGHITLSALSSRIIFRRWKAAWS